MIFLARNPKGFEDKIKEYELDALKNPIQTNRSNLYYDYVLQGFVNPQLLFFRKGKLYRRYTLNLAEMGLLPYF